MANGYLSYAHNKLANCCHLVCLFWAGSHLSTSSTHEAEWRWLFKTWYTLMCWNVPVERCFQAHQHIQIGPAGKISKARKRENEEEMKLLYIYMCCASDVQPALNNFCNNLLHSQCCTHINSNSPSPKGKLGEFFLSFLPFLSSFLSFFPSFSFLYLFLSLIVF